VTAGFDLIAEISARQSRHERGEELAEEAYRLSRSFPDFIRAAWHTVVPVPLTETWHVDAIAEHVQAAYERDITRLLITIPPGLLKSTIITVLGPAWRWTYAPEERIVSSSHTSELATRDTTKSRQVIAHRWYRERWPHVQLSSDENMKTRYSNVLGGVRLRTHVGGGTGDRGSVLLLDDPHNATEAQSDFQLAQARAWWSDTWASRLNANVNDPGVKIVIGQRIHQADVIGFILDGDPDGDRWVHLCLPEHYSPTHKYVSPPERKLASGRVLHGDPRTEEGENIAPAYRDEPIYQDLTAEMSERVRATQFEQLPAPQEGSIWKRGMWRYYPRELLDAAELGDVTGFPRFTRIVASWDTTFKDKTSSDFVCGVLAGVVGPERYILRVTHGRMGLSASITAMKELRQWALDRWRNTGVTTLIENTANGPEIVAQLRREITGVVPTKPSVSADQPSVKKEVRAIACEADFEGGGIFIPGARSQTLDSYDPSLTPPWAQELVEECALFPNGDYDDRVDATSQLLNWVRQRPTSFVTITAPEGDI
jgi:predicted phage terminase large subunit-like protein